MPSFLKRLISRELSNSIHALTDPMNTLSILDSDRGPSQSRYSIALFISCLLPISHTISPSFSSVEGEGF